MSRFRPQLEGIGLTPQKCREYARMWLDLADASEAEKIHVIDAPSAVHVFPKRLNLSRVMEDTPIPESVEMVRCQHDLTAHAFSLVFAHCLISKDFFINPIKTRMLVERFRSLTP